MSFPRYPKYKDSSVEWLGPIPAHWKVLALKHVITMQSGEAITGESIRESGEYPVFGGNGLRGFTDAYTHDGTYALIGRQGALCGNVNYAVGRFWASEHAVVCTPVRPVQTRWLGELLRSMNLGQYSVAAAQPGLSVDIIRQLRIPVPADQEQEAIADFLDRETAKIDALVAEQERLIELLKEKRQAVISHAVTKGLNPAVPMKDSGVEWIGEIPAHWHVARLKHVTDVIVDCPHETPLYSPDGPYRVIRTADLDRGVLHEEDMFRVDEGQYLQRIRRAPLMADDIVYGREGERWGHAALVPTSNTHCLGQRMMQFRAGAQSCAGAFLMWHLNARNVYVQGELDTVGATSPHVNVATIRNFALAVPPLPEQRAIATHLQSEFTRLDGLTFNAQRAITILQERRTALISAAVTGQIDVRGAAGGKTHGVKQGSS
jgi:type I restriction enzyme S subunit